MAKKVRCAVLFLLAALILWPAAAVTAEEMKVAVSPFQNVGPQEEDDYLGFLISEFLASTMSSFEGIEIVERSRLQQIMEEQKLQLSGITNAETTVQVGQLLNAGQMVVGSFARTEATLLISGRIVDVESGRVVASRSIEAEHGSRYMPVFRSFLFQLISNLPEYRVTIPVEARVDAVGQQDMRASENYAKALKELFAQNDESALEYLEKSVGDTQVDFIRFDEMSREYTDTLQRVEGTGIYTRMVKNQVAHNEKLTGQIEPLSMKRSTVKILTDRIAEQLVPGNMYIEAEVPGESEWEIGSVSVTIPPPRSVTAGLTPETENVIDGYFAQQGVLELGREGIDVSLPDRGDLIDPDALEELFAPSWAVTMSYAVEFLDGEGNVLYRLSSLPAPLFRLGGEARQYRSSDFPGFREAQEREGWRLLEDGSVEVQAREIRELDSIQVSLRDESFDRRVEFPLYSDHRWLSIITHAYRKRSVKIVQDGDPAPAFKELLVTDSWFETGDEELDPVPMLPRDGSIAGFAEPTGVVYFAEKSKGSVHARWSGQIEGDAKVQSGEFSPRSVLSFETPGGGALPQGPVEFTAEFDDSVKTASVNLDSGDSYMYRDQSWLNGLVVDADRIYVSGYRTTALDRATGERIWRIEDMGSDPTVYGEYLILRDWMSDELTLVDKRDGGVVWSKEIGAQEVRLYGDSLYTTDKEDDYVRAVDAESGDLLWEVKIRSRIQQLAVTDEVVYVTGRETVALTREGGEELWRTHDGGVDVASDGKMVFITDRERYHRGSQVGWDSTRALDAGTGEELWQRRRLDGEEIYLKEGRLFVRNDFETAELEPRTGETVMALQQAAVVELEPNRVYGTGGRTFAADRKRMKYLWSASDIYGEFLQMDERGLFVGSQASSDSATDIPPGKLHYIDRASGSLIWKSGMGGNDAVFTGGKLFVLGTKHLHVLDLSVLDEVM